MSLCRLPWEPGILNPGPPAKSLNKFFWREKPRGKGIGRLRSPVDSEKREDLPSLWKMLKRWVVRPLMHPPPPGVATLDPGAVYNSWKARILWPLKV